MNDDVDSLKELAPAEWEQFVTDMPKLEGDAAARGLQQDAIALVRLAAYVNARARGEFHERAVVESNIVVRKCAKAMGFSYPQSFDLTF